MLLSEETFCIVFLIAPMFLGCIEFEFGVYQMGLVVFVLYRAVACCGPSYTTHANPPLKSPLRASRGCFEQEPTHKCACKVCRS
jgi:hypothetical protein